VKIDKYTDIICKRFCAFHRADKEGFTCGTYEFVVRNLTIGELGPFTRGITSGSDFSFDGKIKELTCKKCSFMIDGCDFRRGLDSPPYGGYTVVESLMKGGGKISADI